MTDPTTPEPITVRPNMAPVVMSESTKLILVALFAMLADHFIKSESVMSVVLAAGGAVATAVWGVWQRVRTWGALRYIAGLVDDSIAVVGKPKGG